MKENIGKLCCVKKNIRNTFSNIILNKDDFCIILELVGINENCYEILLLSKSAVVKDIWHRTSSYEENNLIISEYEIVE